MNVLDKLTQYFLPKHLRENPLHPEYEEKYSVIWGQLFGGFVMLFIAALMFWGDLFWAPYFLVNVLLWFACLGFSRVDLLQEANMTNAFLLYFLYFPVYRHSGGIYSVNLMLLYPMLSANMYTHRKWGICFIIPALLTVWLLYFLTPDLSSASAIWGSRLYIAIFHSIINVTVAAIFYNVEKKKIAQVTENKALQNNTIHSLNEEVSRRTKELNNMRQTLAADFHDETGNMLSAITRQAAMLKMKMKEEDELLMNVEHIIANSNQLYASSRHFIWNLNNDSDDPQILFNYLTSFGQLFYNGFDISFSAENAMNNLSIRLEPFAAINLIFIFKEAMNNVVKHAEAKDVVLRAAIDGGYLHFTLTDDGTWKEPETKSNHHGVSNMEKRCAQNNFRFNLRHITGIGTRIEIAAPIIHKLPEIVTS